MNLSAADGLTVGFEEELQLVHAQSHSLQPDASTVLDSARDELRSQEVVHELRLSQIETVSPVCHSLDEVAAQLCRLRGEVVQAARAEGNRIVSAGTHPFSRWQDQPFTPKDRYQEIKEEYQQLAREQVIFGLHIHVGIEDRDVAVQVLNRFRPWLCVLLALSANSPFWNGRDTGYSSYRTELWSRWPLSGAPAYFESFSDYQNTCQALVDCGLLEDVTKIYWDARVSSNVPTVEIRICDACTRVEDVVMLTGLVRALAEVALTDHYEGRPAAAIPQEVLCAASWHAARYGLQDTLPDVAARKASPAHELVQKMLDHARPALERNDDWPQVSRLVDKTLTNGNGAQRQREAFARSDSLKEVVEYLAEETAAGVHPRPRPHSL